MKSQIESIIAVILLLVSSSISLVIPTVQRTTPSSVSHTTDLKCRHSASPFQKKSTIVPCLILIGSILTTTIDNGLMSDTAYAYGSDYASETVVNAIKSLKDTIGDEVSSFKSLENIGDIITEGKGVGGSVNYSGVKLERGYIADEDTTIYNPGLSLLTESEKSNLVDAVIENRKVNLERNTWSDKNELAYNFLKQKLDPWHVVELKGFLKFAPAYGAILYLASLAVQQNKRDAFPTAYLISAGAFFLPIAVLLAKGP